jgi:hypothetical protein
MPSATASASVQKAKKKLTAFLKSVQDIPLEILEREAIRIKVEAVELTPYKTGRLENSVRTRVAKDKRRPGIIVQASARDPKSGYNYAGIQHENVNFNHPIKGRDHFLTIPMQAAYTRIVRNISRRLKDAAR